MQSLGFINFFFKRKPAFGGVNIGGIVSFSLLVVLGSALIVIDEKLKTEEG